MKIDLSELELREVLNAVQVYQTHLARADFVNTTLLSVEKRMKAMTEEEDERRTERR